MALPYSGSPLKELERDRLHRRDIAAALRALRDRLGEEGIPFAVLGALAFRHDGHERFTEDVDILTTPEGLARIHERRVGRGWSPRAAGRRKRLKDTVHEVQIDILTSGEHAGSDASPVVFPSPLDPGFVEVDGIRYPALERLIEFKLAGHVWGKRIQDLAEVVKLIQANRLDASLASSLHPDLKAKYAEALDLARDEMTLGQE